MGRGWERGVFDWAARYGFMQWWLHARTVLLVSMDGIYFMVVI